MKKVNSWISETRPRTSCQHERHVCRLCRAVATQTFYELCTKVMDAATAVMLGEVGRGGDATLLPLLPLLLLLLGQYSTAVGVLGKPSPAFRTTLPCVKKDTPLASRTRLPPTPTPTRSSTVF